MRVKKAKKDWIRVTEHGDARQMRWCRELTYSALPTESGIYSLNRLSLLKAFALHKQ